MFLRQSTASQEIMLGRFVDSTDGNTEETGLTIANTDIKIFKGGATTLANKNSGGGTHVANGMYSAVLDATDTDTVGLLEVHVHVSGALSVRHSYYVVEEVVFDSLFAASAVGYQVPIWAAASSTVNLSATTIKTLTDAPSDSSGVTTLISRLGTPSNLGGGATVAANLSDIEAQTDDIGVAGAGLTDLGGFSTTAKGQIQTEAEDAIVTHRLDELLNADSDIDGAAPPTVGSVFHELLTKTTGSFTYDQTTDSLEALRDNVGTAGAGLTAADDAVITAIAALNNLSSAQAQTAAESALQTYHLDHFIQSADPGSIVADSSLLAKLVSKSATPSFASYSNQTDSHEALRDRGDAAWTTATGFSTHSAADVWAVATRVLTAGTNIALAKGTGVTGFNDIAVSDIFTTAMTEAYRGTGATGTPAQLAYEILSLLCEFTISSTTLTTKKLDGSTTAKTYTLNSATTPTGITEAT